MRLSKYLDPKNEYAFKKIFGTEQNKDILIHFLNDMLEFREGKKIKDVAILNPNQDPKSRFKKQSIVDVLCKDEQDRQFILEMQVAKRDEFTKRASFCISRTYADQLNNGESFNNLNDVIFLGITNFTLFPDLKNYRSRFRMLDEGTFQQCIPHFSYVFLELPKFEKSIDQLETIVEKWAYFFKHASETQESELAQIAGNDLIIARAYEALNQYGWTQEERVEYEVEMDKERTHFSEINTAAADGIVEGKRQTAKKMLEKGMPIETIIELTGLSEQEINSLQH